MPNGVLGEERRTIGSDRSRPRSSRLWWATTNLRDGGVLLPGFVQAPSRPCTWRNAPLGRCRTNVRRSFTRSQHFLCENNENDEYGGGEEENGRGLLCNPLHAFPELLCHRLHCRSGGCRRVPNRMLFLRISSTSPLQLCMPVSMSHMQLTATDAMRLTATEVALFPVTETASIA